MHQDDEDFRPERYQRIVEGLNGRKRRFLRFGHRSFYPENSFSPFLSRVGSHFTVSRGPFPLRFQLTGKFERSETPRVFTLLLSSRSSGFPDGRILLNFFIRTLSIRINPDHLRHTGIGRPQGFSHRACAPNPAGTQDGSISRR